MQNTVGSFIFFCVVWHSRPIYHVDITSTVFHWWAHRGVVDVFVQVVPVACQPQRVLIDYRSYRLDVPLKFVFFCCCCLLLLSCWTKTIFFFIKLFSRGKRYQFGNVGHYTFVRCEHGAFFYLATAECSTGDFAEMWTIYSIIFILFFNSFI
jgi:hypothetical protein